MPAHDPATAEPLEVLRLGNEGDGIAEGPDGAVFIPGALPGETVARDRGGRPGTRIGSTSPERRPVALCPHFPACGGCTVQHMDDPLYTRWKAGLLKAAVATQGLDIEAAPMISVPQRSRRRAAFGGSLTSSGFVLGFHARGTHDIVPMTACAVLAPEIVAALPLLRSIGARVAEPDGEIRLSVLVAREGLDVTVSAGKGRGDGRLQVDLARLASAGPVARLTLNGDPLVQRAVPTVLIAGVAVSPPPAAFLQAATEAERAMGDLAVSGLPRKAKRAADLFAGLGTLALALAPRVAVEAFDSDRRLIDALTHATRHAQGLKPVAANVRDLFRDPLSPRELDRFDAVVFDPPRAGAKVQAEAIAKSKVQRVIAVSCNPATLARDLAILVAGGYAIRSLTPIDQFLYTPHLEAVAILSR
jgi:23S rRNA (uracil1939-C5)-methyltransferase